MAKNKGANYCFVTKTLMKKTGAAVEAAFLKTLTPEELRFHEQALPSSWLDADRVSQIIAKAGPLLFPDDPRPLYTCGRLESHDQLVGVYRIFLKIFSVENILKQTAKIWSTYHDTGRAWPEKLAQNHIVLHVEDYADMTPQLQNIVAGYCAGTLELSGVANVRVTTSKGKNGVWNFDIIYDP